MNLSVIIIMTLLFIIQAQEIIAKHDRAIERAYYEVRKELHKQEEIIMQYQDKNHYVVKSMYLCRHLQQLGFELKKVKPNKFYPRHNVYLFEHTEELMNALTK